MHDYVVVAVIMLEDSVQVEHSMCPRRRSWWIIGSKIWLISGHKFPGGFNIGDLSCGGECDKLETDFRGDFPF